MTVIHTLRHAVVSAALTMIASALSAQGSAGRVFYPRTNIANPNLVAFERLDGDRREIQFLLADLGKEIPLARKAAAPSANVITLPGLGGDERITSYSGDLDWRPVADGSRYWFAYVASEDKGVNLFVQSIDRNGVVAAAEPLRVPGGAGARSPRWSPDGRHLSFVSDDGALNIVPEIDGALRAASATRMRPARVATGRGAVLFPEWSPMGNYIAYQVARQDGGTRRFGLEIIQVDARSGAVSAQPIAVAESNDGDNKFRPSWSPKEGRYLAFYVDRPGSGRADDQLLDIGIVELQADPASKRIFRSEAKAGRSRRLADGVIPSGTRGPTWTRVAGASGPELSIVYVQKDEARNNPVVVASTESWIAMRARQEYSATLSTPWGTANHKDIAATDMRGQTRYVYVSVEGGGEKVKFRDATAPWAEGAAPLAASDIVVATQGGGAVTAPSTGQSQVSGPAVSPPSTIKKVSDARRAPGVLIMMPGATQLYEGRNGSGALLLTAALAGGALSGYSGLQQLQAVHEPGRIKPFLAGGAIAGLAWIIGIVETSQAHSSETRVSVDMAPSGKPDGSQVTRVGLRLPLPGSNR